MDKDINFDSFVRILKKYPTNEVAKFFSEQERICNDNTEKNKLTKRDFNFQSLIIKPWLFPEIIYYSTFNNDYRHKQINEKILWDVYGLYQNFDMDKESLFLHNKLETDKHILNYLMYGLTQQQLIYQKNYKYINRFNRNYYLLKDLIIDGVSLSSIVEDKFKLTIAEYMSNLAFIAILSKIRIVLNTQEILNLIKNKESYLTVIDYLSVDYKGCRATPLKQNVFKVKPILESQKGEYIVPSFCLMMYNLGDNLYWLFKDKFSSNNKFVNKFGEVFENYVFEILIKTFGDVIYRIPRQDNQKSADFYFESENYIFIIEVKAGVAKLDSKTTMLNKESFDSFIKNNLTDALEQIDSSAKIYNTKHVIPIIVNYDLLYVEDALLSNIQELYNPQNFDVNETILLGIDDLENLLYTYNTVEKLNILIKTMIEKSGEFGLQIYKLLENTSGHANYFYEDLFDIDEKMMIHKP